MMTRATKKIRLGLLLKPERYILNRFTCATTPYLIRGIIDRFDCELIASQSDYNYHYNSLDVFLSMEPGFAAPIINWRPLSFRVRGKKKKLGYVLCSDPHNDPRPRQRYILDNRIDFLLGLYKDPFSRHWTKIPESMFVHFPWTIPDEWFSFEGIKNKRQDFIGCFGGSQHEAYSMRNWCRQFPFVKSFENSGVENKIMSDREYFNWLKGFDAAIAAGSKNPIYDLTTPKYFEIAAAGCLLFGQQTADLEGLGFVDGKTCVIFDKNNFEAKCREYLDHPDSSEAIRAAGRQMVWDRHRLSTRLDFLENHIREHL